MVSLPALAPQVDELVVVANIPGSLPEDLPEEVRGFETDLIQAALVKTGGNQLRAARLLGLKHTTLNAKIKRYGISIRPFAAQNGEQEIAA